MNAVFGGRKAWGGDALAIFAILLVGAFCALWGAAHATDRAFAIQM